MAKFMSVCYGIALIPRYKSFFKNPVGALVKLSRNTLLTSTSITGSIGTAWAMCCLFQKVLPGKVLPRGRFWLSGMLGGLWAFVDSRGGRGNFLYSFRLGLVSAWKVLVKKGVVRGVKYGFPPFNYLSRVTHSQRLDRYLYMCFSGQERRCISLRSLSDAHQFPLRHRCPLRLRQRCTKGIELRPRPWNEGSYH